MTAKELRRVPRLEEQVNNMTRVIRDRDGIVHVVKPWDSGRTGEALLDLRSRDIWSLLCRSELGFDTASFLHHMFVAVRADTAPSCIACITLAAAS